MRWIEPPNLLTTNRVSKIRSIPSKRKPSRLENRIVTNKPDEMLKDDYNTSNTVDNKSEQNKFIPEQKTSKDTSSVEQIPKGNLYYI